MRFRSRMAYAAERTRLETLRWSRDKAADPNAEGSDGDRPWDWAMYRADQDRSQLFRRFGAKPGAAKRAAAYATPEGVTDSRSALKRSAALLLSAAPSVFKAKACVSCHNQLLPLQVSA